jgi:hypothetical protein
MQVNSCANLGANGDPLQIDLPQGEVMSTRNAFVLLVALCALTFLVACGGSGSAPANATPPPTGGFSNSNLNGTYVFSISGIDENSAPLSIVGTITANGSGTITGGALDMNDAAFPSDGITAPADLAISSSTYNITVDGRGETKLNVNNPLGSSLTLDFVLQDSSHGLVSEFDTYGTGSGTLDLQTSGVTPTGSYAFSFSGAGTSSAIFATVGNFTLSGSGISAGTEDFNEGAFAYTGQSLAGTVVLGPSSSPKTTLTTAQFGTQTYDVYAIDATHLKFIEMDASGTLSGDAFSQPSTTLPTGTLAFTLAGSYPAADTASAAGGFMVTDGAGNITDSSTVDANNGGSPSPSPITFSGTYVAAGTGRYTLSLPTTDGFTEGTTYEAYPCSGGVLLLEVDDDGIMAGAAYTQVSGATFAASQGYALNLSGVFSEDGSSSEVDDIAEFTAASGGTLTGIIDENSLEQTVVSLPLSGNYSTPDTNGRGQIATTAGNSTSSTLNGGFSLNYYTVDGTTFPFIDMDTTQVATGVFVEQSATASSSALAKAHAMFVPHPFFHAHSAKQKKQ